VVPAGRLIKRCSRFSTLAHLTNVRWRPWFPELAAALADQLDLRDDQRMLHESLEEERKADALLTKLAKGEVNQDALAA
jgi:Domain of unknown function (DUF892)